MGTIIRAKSIRVYNQLYAPILSYNMMKKTRFRQTRSHDTKYFKKKAQCCSSNRSDLEEKHTISCADSIATKLCVMNYHNEERFEKE